MKSKGNKIIIGAGRQAEETYHFITDVYGKDDLIAFAVDNPGSDHFLAGIPVIALEQVFAQYEADTEKPEILIAIGDVSIVKRLAHIFEIKGFTFFNVLNSSIRKERQKQIGHGVTICEGSILTCNVTIGNHVLVNVGCTISHDCIIGNFVNISPGCHLAGRVEIEDEVFIGTGASFIPGVKIGKGSIIAAGACITKDVPPYKLAAGVPATIKKTIR